MNKSALIFALVYPAILTWLYFVLLTGSSQSVQQAAYGIGKLIQFGLPLVCVGLLWREPLRWPKPTARGLAFGISFGLVVGGGAIAIYFAWFKSAGIFGEAAVRMSSRLAEIGVQNPAIYAVVALFYSLIHSLLEEYYWRWFVFGQLRREISLSMAILLSSLAFMAHHVIVLGIYFGWQSPWTYLFSLATAIGGAFWAWLYNRSGSIYGPWISHLLIDTAIFGIGYDLMRSVT
ncbi:MAG TPA: type II CAAX endopeptidase family protein [Pirellulales bacterium]